MNLDIGLLARALVARVMQLEQENARLRAELAERDEPTTEPEPEET
jgi:hypothetical protein